ncbi:MAG TPA: glutamate racemase [Candidatus Cloacimonadota bacterium]|nr:glutamate racemase [Candidatus Cloacimonadota bacterium]
MKKPIGIFDSGVGGLTVYRMIREYFPEEDLIYFGDTARVPYGPKSPNTIIDYSIQNARFLLQRGIKILIVACNTSSAYALDRLREITGIPIIGVIEPGAERAAVTTKNKRIGIIGTEATVRSDAYRLAIRRLLPDCEVFSQACPLFVPIVEEGWQDTETAQMIAEEYLGVFKNYGIDSLVLGCTHYPLLHDTIRHVLGQEVQLVDSAESIALYLQRIIAAESDGQAGTDTFFVSDNEEKFPSIAGRIMPKINIEPKRVRLFESWFAD